MSKIIYNSWNHVPSGLKTKTQLARDGMKPCKGQAPVAYKRGFKSSPDYALYDATLAIPKRKPTQVQLTALATNRDKQRCIDCGVQVFGRLFHQRCPHCADGYAEHVLTRVRFNEAITWANQMLQSDALILDTETTGLADDAEILELAIIDMQGRIYWNTRLRPKATDWPDAQAIHGIHPAHVAKACTLPQMYSALAALLPYQRIVIYNAAFDQRLLDQSCAAWGLPVIGFNTCCAMHHYTHYCQQKRWVSMPYGDHTALGDCFAVLKILHVMANAAPVEIEETR